MQGNVRWLLLVFTLPTSKASERVQMWRKLQRFGSIPFRNAGSLLPNTPENQERFEWLATAIRASKGEASILQIQAIDDVSSGDLQDQFRKVRTRDYMELIKDLQKLKPSAKGPPEVWWDMREEKARAPGKARRQGRTDGPVRVSREGALG